MAKYKHVGNRYRVTKTPVYKKQEPTWPAAVGGIIFFFILVGSCSQG